MPDHSPIRAGNRADFSHGVGKQFGFNATLENWAEGMDYCAVSVPAKITESLGTKGPVLVSASVNKSEPFKVTQFTVGGGKHNIHIK